MKRILLLLCLLSGCQIGAEKNAARTEIPHAAELAQVAETYGTWGRVDDQTRWAPTMCAMPSAGRIRTSKAKTDGTHGRKLYTVFAKDRNAYVSSVGEGAVDNPVGQVLVKESWNPVKVDSESDDGSWHDFQRTARTEDGELWKMGSKLGLFVMLKTEAEGWIYATIDADNHVLEAGNIAVCAECHEQAPHDRVFGMN